MQEVFTLRKLTNFLELAPIATQKDPSLASVPHQLKGLDARTVSSILQLGVRLPQAEADLHAVVMESAQYYLRLYAALAYLADGTIPAAIITYEGQEGGGLIVTPYSVRRDQMYPSEEVTAALVGRSLKAMVYMTRVIDPQAGVARLTLVVTTPVVYVRSDMLLLPRPGGMNINTRSNACERAGNDPFLRMIPIDPNLQSYLIPLPAPAPPAVAVETNGNGHAPAAASAPAAVPPPEPLVAVSEPTTWPVATEEAVTDEPELDDPSPMESILDDGGEDDAADEASEDDYADDEADDNAPDDDVPADEF